jgi:hypothetical protein
MADLIITPHYAEPTDMLGLCGLGGKMVFGQFDSDGGNYVTNGVSLDLSALLPRGVGLILFENKSGYIFQYDYTAKKVKVYFADYDAGADGALIQYTNGAAFNVDGVGFVAFGY